MAHRRLPWFWFRFQIIIQDIMRKSKRIMRKERRIARRNNRKNNSKFNKLFNAIRQFSEINRSWFIILLALFVSSCDPAPWTNGEPTTETRYHRNTCLSRHQRYLGWIWRVQNWSHNRRKPYGENHQHCWKRHPLFKEWKHPLLDKKLWLSFRDKDIPQQH